MLGLSYGELFLIIGATAALIGPKDIPRIARVAGRLTGRSIGYIQLVRGQFDTVMEQSRARQMHKELNDQFAQLEAISHEIRSKFSINPSPYTKQLVDNTGPASLITGNPELEKTDKEEQLLRATSKLFKDQNSTTSGSSDMHSQATAYAKLVESTALNSGSESSEVLYELTDKSGLTVLPVSAESTGLLPNRRDDVNGSDIVLEAILEADVARNAKDFFAQPQNQIKSE